MESFNIANSGPFCKVGKIKQPNNKDQDVANGLQLWNINKIGLLLFGF